MPAARSSGSLQRGVRHDPRDRRERLDAAEARRVLDQLEAPPRTAAPRRRPRRARASARCRRGLARGAAPRARGSGPGRGSGDAPARRPGARARAAASALAPAHCARTRSASVASPRVRSHAAVGSRIAPVRLRKPRTRAMSSAPPSNTPATRSECPPSALVAECMTTSAPSAKGRWTMGVANVESTSSRAPWACARAARAGRSATRTTGFERPSARTSRAPRS